LPNKTDGDLQPENIDLQCVMRMTMTYLTPSYHQQQSMGGRKGEIDSLVLVPTRDSPASSSHY